MAFFKNYVSQTEIFAIFSAYSENKYWYDVDKCFQILRKIAFCPSKSENKHPVYRLQCHINVFSCYHLHIYDIVFILTFKWNTKRFEKQYQKPLKCFDWYIFLFFQHFM